MKLASSLQTDLSGRTVVCAGALLTTLLLVLLDLARLRLYAPRVSSATSALSFLAVGWAVGSLLACTVLLARAELARRLLRFGLGGMALVGACDATVLLLLVFFAQDPRRVGPNLRVALSIVAIVGLAGAHGFWFARGGQLHRSVRPISAFVGASICAFLLSKLRWNGEDWFRLAIQLILAVCIADLIRIRAQRLATRWVGAALALAAVLLACAGPLLRAFPETRLAIHHRTSHVRTWVHALEYMFDRNGDGSIAMLGGAFSEPASDLALDSVEPAELHFAAGHAEEGDAPIAGADDLTVRASVGMAAGRDVLLLSIDSLRWDAVEHLAPLRDALGPHLQFTSAVSPAAATKESLSSTLRGRPVSKLNFESSDETGGLVLWRDPNPTLGHALQRAGYRAITVPTSHVGDPRTGVQSGFESIWVANYDARMREPTRPPHTQTYVSAGEVLPVVLEAARDTKTPLCAWVHLMEPHAPYRLRDPAQCDRTKPSQCYAAAVRQSAQTLAHFLRTFTRIRGRAPLVAVFGDHGEEFGEHGGDFHGSSVHAEQVRVGFLLAVPGLSPARIDAPVSTASLPATVLELLGLEVPRTMTEPSLVGSLAGTYAWPDVAASELRIGPRFMTAYTGRTHRYLHDPAHGVELLFDIARDPHEQTDVKHDALALDRMRKLARRWDAANAGPPKNRSSFAPRER